MRMCPGEMSMQRFRTTRLTSSLFGTPEKRCKLACANGTSDQVRVGVQRGSQMKIGTPASHNGGEP
jgi:hypothetical protein